MEDRDFSRSSIFLFLKRHIIIRHYLICGDFVIDSYIYLSKIYIQEGKMLITTMKGQYILKDLDLEAMKQKIIQFAIKDQCSYIYVDVPKKSYLFIVKLVSKKHGSKVFCEGHIEDYKVKEW